MQNGISLCLVFVCSFFFCVCGRRRLLLERMNICGSSFLRFKY